MELETPVPDTFIVGAPKCGTTSLYDWLASHPEVYMSPFKEPRYFCHDLTFYFRYNHIADYLGLFGAAEGYERVGEASTWYLHSERAPEAIRELCGEDVRIIAMVRNPVDMVHSWHSQLVWMGNEPIEDLEEAWRAQGDRREGRRLPERVNPWEGLFYSEIARYTGSIERYLDAFGAERVHVIVFDDLVESNPRTYKEVCRFLGIDESFDPGFERSNPNTRVRSGRLRELAREPPAPVKAVTEALPMQLRLRLRRMVNRLNTEVAERDPMPDPLRREIADAYADDVHALSELLDRDLTHWIQEAG